MLGKTNVKLKPNKKKPKIDYVEYLEATGTQYIDTGLVPKSTTRMVIKLKYNNTSGTQIMGWGSAGYQESFMVGISGSSRTFVSLVSSTYSNSDSKIPADTNIHIFDVKSGSQKLDGVQFATDVIGDTAIAGQTLYLFCTHGEWTSNLIDLCNCNLYYCEFYDGNELIRDYKPCKDGAGVYCLYDEIEKRYYYNQGTGSFVGGASI